MFGMCVFALVTVALSAALETTEPQWRDPQFGHRLRMLQKYQREEPARPLVLFLGTSRTQNAIVPSAMSLPGGENARRLFNFGQSGASPLKVMLTLRRLLDNGVHPAAIVVEVLPVWLTPENAEEQFQHAVQQLSFADVRDLESFTENTTAFRGEWLGARAVPWQSQRTSLMSHLLPQWLPWQKRINSQWLSLDADGFSPFVYENPPAEFRTAATQRTRDQHARSFARIQFGSASLQAMRDLASVCRNENIALAFFEPPVAPVFRGWFQPGVWEAGDRDLRSLAVDLGVEVFSPYDSFADCDFADGHHMLRGAANRYSKWLAETHLGPWLDHRR
jgi:hypothetical protein